MIGLKYIVLLSLFVFSYAKFSSTQKKVKGVWRGSNKNLGMNEQHMASCFYSLKSVWSSKSLSNGVELFETFFMCSVGFSSLIQYFHIINPSVLFSRIVKALARRINSKITSFSHNKSEYEFGNELSDFLLEIVNTDSEEDVEIYIELGFNILLKIPVIKDILIRFNVKERAIKNYCRIKRLLRKINLKELYSIDIKKVWNVTYVGELFSKISNLSFAGVWNNMIENIFEPVNTVQLYLWWYNLGFKKMIKNYINQTWSKSDFIVITDIYNLIHDIWDVTDFKEIFGYYIKYIYNLLQRARSALSETNILIRLYKYILKLLNNPTVKKTFNDSIALVHKAWNATNFKRSFNNTLKKAQRVFNGAKNYIHKALSNINNKETFNKPKNTLKTGYEKVCEVWKKVNIGGKIRNGMTKIKSFFSNLFTN